MFANFSLFIWVIAILVAIFYTGYGLITLKGAWDYSDNKFLQLTDKYQGITRTFHWIRRLAIAIIAWLFVFICHP